jgi:hypothetical protein
LFSREAYPLAQTFYLQVCLQHREPTLGFADNVVEHRYLGEMQQKHQAEVVDLKSKHSTEVTMLNNIIRKAKRWFPMLEAYLQIESLCKRIGFTAEQISVLLAGKALNFSGSLYSEKHRRKFNVENAEIKVFSDSTKPNQLFLCINRQPIVEWFKEQWNISKDRRTLNPKINKEEKI